MIIDKDRLDMWIEENNWSVESDEYIGTSETVISVDNLRFAFAQDKFEPEPCPQCNVARLHNDLENNPHYTHCYGCGRKLEIKHDRTRK